MFVFAFEQILYHIAGVLITGGYPNVNTAELYLPSSGARCALPTLPDSRWGHTSDDGLLCAGWDTSDSCLQWGSWEAAVTLDVRRGYHVSWTPVGGPGTWLMGGAYSVRTTTLITPDGTQEPGFSLKYVAE